MVTKVGVLDPGVGVFTSDCIDLGSVATFLTVEFETARHAFDLQRITASFIVYWRNKAVMRNFRTSSTAKFVNYVAYTYIRLFGFLTSSASLRIRTPDPHQKTLRISTSSASIRIRAPDPHQKALRIVMLAMQEEKFLHLFSCSIFFRFQILK
jgi:hypothetical protein